MRQRFSITRGVLALLVLVLGLVAYIWYDNPERQAQIEKKKNQVLIFTYFKPEEINRIEVKNKESETALVKEENAWFVVYNHDEKYPIVDAFTAKVSAVTPDMV